MMPPPPLFPAPACWWQTQVSGLLRCWRFWLGAYSVGFFSSQLCCPLRFQNSPQTHLWEGFLLFGNFSYFTTPSPGWVSIPNSSVSLFMFYILSYFLSKRMACLSGCLCPPPVFRSCFVEVAQHSRWSFDEFVGERVVSPFYSSTILGPPSYMSILIETGMSPATPPNPSSHPQPFSDWNLLAWLLTCLISVHIQSYNNRICTYGLVY